MSSRKRRGGSGSASEVRGPPFWGAVCLQLGAGSVLTRLPRAGSALWSSCGVIAVGIRAKKAFSDAAIYWTKNITFLEKMYCL